jgi:hypothetical protein
MQDIKGCYISWVRLMKTNKVERKRHMFFTHLSIGKLREELERLL